MKTLLDFTVSQTLHLIQSLQQSKTSSFDYSCPCLSHRLSIKSGVAKQIQECEPKALSTHCHDHSLSLSVKNTTNHSKILSDTMSNTNEIVKLVKYSPKRENFLGELKKNLQYEDGEYEDVVAGGLTSFSTTRCTVRAI